jgi:predicted nucleic acid-binding protein
VIVVDSTVWIDFLNGRKAPHVRRLDAALGATDIIVGDLKLARCCRAWTASERRGKSRLFLRRFEIVSMVGHAVAVAAARNFRTLRRRGITIGHFEQ